jgi:hypothetical protein
MSVHLEKNKLPQLVGFKPTLTEGNWFRTNHLNHSATFACEYVK